MPMISSPGIYPNARAMSGQLGKAGTGTKQVAVAFETDEGEHITAFLYFTDKTEDRTMATLRLCGWEGDDITDLRGIDGSCLVDLDVIEEDDQNGNPRIKVAWINAPGERGGGVSVKPLAADEAAMFKARMMAKAQASRATGPKPVRAGRPTVPQSSRLPPPADDEPPPRTDDDLPF